MTTPKAIIGPHRAMTTTGGDAAVVVDNVVYSYAPGYQPAIQYHSIPSSCTGGADTLDEARSSYRTQVARRLNVDRHELPPAIEHLEAVVAGMWVRTKVGAIHRGRDADRMFLQILLSRGQAQDELRAHLDAATAAGEAPVVVIVEPDDTLGTVSRPDDSPRCAVGGVFRHTGHSGLDRPLRCRSRRREPRRAHVRESGAAGYAHRHLHQDSCHRQLSSCASAPLPAARCHAVSAHHKSAPRHLNHDRPARTG